MSDRSIDRYSQSSKTDSASLASLELSSLLTPHNFIYKTSIKLRGDAEFDSFPEELCWDVKKASNTVDQVEMFKSCFASIESSSLSSENESAKYIFDTFRELKFNENILTPGFSFCEFYLDEIKKAVDELPSSSSPGF
ncbi:hypothetical protein BpHYR1_025835, partial [Brachionus plicatilis]